MDIDIFNYYEERAEDTIRLAQTAVLAEEEEEQEELDPTRVCWRNLSENENQCKILTGFNIEEFLTLFELIEDQIIENTGRGLKSKIPKQDKLLMTLCYLKHYETVDKMRKTFSISKSHLHSILEMTIESISPYLYEYFVTNLQDRIKEDEEIGDALVFPDAKYVLNACFQPIWTPAGTSCEKKQYYNSQAKLYGLKSQCLHDRKGRVVHSIAAEKGGIENLKICKTNSTALKEMLNNVAVLATADYQGLEKLVKAILPYKKQANKPFTRQQYTFNEQLASEVAVCEEFYARIKSRYRIMSSKYRNSREEYTHLFRLCVALTNYHILLYPL